MPFIGNQPALSYTSFAKQDFTTSATTSYTLDHPVTNENEIALFINFVRQEPTTAYTATNTSLTLTSATSATDDMYCVFLGKAVQTVNPPNGSVGLSQLSATGTKDTTTFLRGDNTFASAGGANTPYFFATLSGNQTLSDDTNTKIAFNTASIDSDSAFDTSNNRFVVPSGKAGKYYIYAQLNSDSGDVEYIETTIAKNGTEVNYIINNPNSSHSNLQTNIATILDLAASDYVELFTSSNQTSGNATITASVRGKNTFMLGYKLID